ncbi:GNAT family N-acetyltransferase [candidate division WOR-3 bacterium]|nr:GNAT family N-acetyltransferase [candidate division WOR-3 bacterium]
MEVRKLEARDIAQIKILLEELAETLGHDFSTDERELKRQLGEMETNPVIYGNFVLEENEKILGFISLVHYGSFFHRKGTTLINELVVGESARGKGAGKILLEKAFEEAKMRDMDEIEVGVMKENLRAQEFYKKNGLEEESLLLGKEFD